MTTLAYQINLGPQFYAVRGTKTKPSFFDRLDTVVNELTDMQIAQLLIFFLNLFVLSSQGVWYLLSGKSQYTDTTSILVFILFGAFVVDVYAIQTAWYLAQGHNVLLTKFRIPIS